MGGCTDFPEPLECEAACYKLQSCGLCVLDAFGACLPTVQCISECRSTSAGRTLASCVNSVQGCDSYSLQACFL